MQLSAILDWADWVTWGWIYHALGWPGLLILYFVITIPIAIGFGKLLKGLDL